MLVLHRNKQDQRPFELPCESCSFLFVSKLTLNSEFWLPLFTSWTKTHTAASLFFETGPHYVSLADLELTELCLPMPLNAGIIALYHHIWLKSYSFPMFSWSIEHFQSRFLKLNFTFLGMCILLTSLSLNGSVVLWPSTSKETTLPLPFPLLLVSCQQAHTPLPWVSFSQSALLYFAAFSGLRVHNSGDMLTIWWAQKPSKHNQTHLRSPFQTNWTSNLREKSSL